MTAKEYLMKIQIHRRSIESVQQKIEMLYNEAAGIKAIVYDKDHVQTSPANRFEEMMIRIDAECSKWARMRIRYEREVRKRVDQISKLGNPDYSELLMLRYVDLDDGRQHTGCTRAIRGSNTCTGKRWKLLGGNTYDYY